MPGLSSLQLIFKNVLTKTNLDCIRKPRTFRRKSIVYNNIILSVFYIISK